MRKKILFIINPISGRRPKEDLENIIRSNIDISIFDYRISYTQRPKHARELAKAAADEGIDIVCAVGGDGSAHEAGTALIGTETALAIIPTGSGNGLARHLKIPMDISDSIRCINRMRTIEMDTAIAGKTPFLGTCGYGMDAAVARRFDEGGKRGIWKYISLTAKELLGFKPIEAKISIGGKKWKTKAFMCSVANSSEFGNGFKISPKSIVADGRLELVIVRPFSFWKAPYMAYRFFSGKNFRPGQVDIIQFETLTIDVGCGPAHYDGEPSDADGEIEISIVPKSLKVVTGDISDKNKT